MRIPGKLDCLLKDAHIDFTQFVLLDATRAKGGGADVLLVPRHKTGLQHFNLQHRQESFYYKSIDSLLSSCVTAGSISKIRAALLKLRWRRLERRLK